MKRYEAHGADKHGTDPHVFDTESGQVAEDLETIEQAEGRTAEYEQDKPTRDYSGGFSGGAPTQEATPEQLARLEELRAIITAHYPVSPSYGELAELQDLAAVIPAGEVELLEWAGVPEFADSDECPDPQCSGGDDCSPIYSATDIHPRCDVCGKVQKPEDNWNGETGNHVACEDGEVVPTMTEQGPSERPAKDTCSVPECDGLLADFDRQLCDGHAEDGAPDDFDALPDPDRIYEVARDIAAFDALIETGDVNNWRQFMPQFGGAR